MLSDSVRYRRCGLCYWWAICPDAEGRPLSCEDFTSLVDEELTEEERQEIYEDYVAAWREYVSEFND